jgi:hypothetical protein
MRLALILLVLSAMPAQACRSPLTNKSIFFQKLPAEAQLAAHVTILEKEGVTALAQVNEVVRGNLNTKVINLVLPLETSCGPSVEIGQSGIVFGAMRDADHLVVESRTNGEMENLSR